MPLIKSLTGDPVYSYVRPEYKEKEKAIKQEKLRADRTIQEAERERNEYAVQKKKDKGSPLIYKEIKFRIEKSLVVNGSTG